MVNAALLEDTMGHIRAHPELHNPNFFFEQSFDFPGEMTACFGGRACLLGGLEAVLAHGFRGSAVVVNGEYQAAWTAARDLLGLSPAWATSLFSPINTRRTLELKVKDVLNGVDVPLSHHAYWEAQ